MLGLARARSGIEARGVAALEKYNTYLHLHLHLYFPIQNDASSRAIGLLFFRRRLSGEYKLPARAPILVIKRNVSTVP
jgi:hypothetical protein